MSKLVDNFESEIKKIVKAAKETSRKIDEISASGGSFVIKEGLSERYHLGEEPFPDPKPTQTELKWLEKQAAKKQSANTPGVR
jgi:hypothetical protein